MQIEMEGKSKSSTDESEPNVGQFLFREFCNHVYLGQWELARGCALTLAHSYKHNSDEIIKLKTTLQNLSRNPSQARHSWSTFSSPSYLSFLAFQLLQLISQDEETENFKQFQSQAEFNIMLEELFPKASDSVFKELSWLYSEVAKFSTTQQENTNNHDRVTLDLAVETKKVLREALLCDPSGISLFLKKMCFTNNVKYTEKIRTKICNIYFMCLIHCLKQTESSFKKQDLRQFKELVPKVYLFLSHFPEHVLGKSVEYEWSADLNEVLLLIIGLCESRALRIEDVYAAMLGRLSPRLLQYFCAKEDEFFCRGVPSSKITNLQMPFISNEGQFHHREALLWSLKTNSHFLENILNFSIEQVLKGRFSEASSAISDSLLIRLQPLILILSWNFCSDDISACNVMQAIKSWQPDTHCDISLIGACQKFQHNVSATELCIEYYKKQVPDAEPSEVMNKTRNILNQLQTQSPLTVLQRVFGLKNIPSDEVLDLLNQSYGGTTESKYTPQNRALCHIMNRDCIIFRGYLAITLVLEAIFFCCELKQLLLKKNYNMLNIQCRKTTLNSENLQNSEETSTRSLSFDNVKSVQLHLNEFLSKHGAETTYNKFVTERLEKTKLELKQIFPVTFRLEILENIFSLLFLSSSDLHDSIKGCSDSDEGHEGEEKRCNTTFVDISTDNLEDLGLHELSKSEKNRESVLMAEELTLASLNSPPKDKFNQDIEVNKKYTGRFVISTVKLKDSRDVKNEISEIYSGHGSTGSNSSNGIPTTGFLCNELIVHDLLLVLKDAILDANAEVYKTMGDAAETKESKLYKVNGRLNSQFISPNIKSSVTFAELPHRMSQLLKHVYDAQWRLKLVRSDVFKASFHTTADLGNSDKCVAAAQGDKKFPTQSSRNVLNSTILPDEMTHLKNVTDVGSSNLSDNIDCSEKGTGKRRKKRKHKRSFRNSYPGADTNSEPSIIQRMLSSPHALLRYSLWRRNLAQAEQVIKFFQLQSSTEAKEVTFAEDLNKLCVKMEESDKLKVKFPQKKPAMLEKKNKAPVSDIIAIANAAASGMQSSATSSIIDQELSSWKIPVIPEIAERLNHLSTTEHILLSGSESLYSLVLSDIAYTGSFSLEQSSVFLDMSVRRWNDNKYQSAESSLAKKKYSSIRGNLKTIKLISNILKGFQSFEQDSETKHTIEHIFFPLQADFRIFSESFVNYFGSLDNSIFTNQISQWKMFCFCVEEFVTLLQEEQDKKKSVPAISSITCFEPNNKLHISYKKLSKSTADLCNWSSESVRPHSTKYVNYLFKLYSHIQQVTGALLGCRTHDASPGSIVYTSYFSVLKESPADILQRMVLKNEISPQKIEKLAIRMKVDLAHVLAQGCFPHIPLFRGNTCNKLQSNNNTSTVSKGFPLLVLNESTKIWNSPRHPDLVACELLKDLLAMVQDTAIAKDSGGVLTVEALLSFSKHSELPLWLNKCGELAYVDLDELQSKEEKLAFFVNVTNIAWLHGILFEAMTCGLQSSKAVENQSHASFTGENNPNPSNSAHHVLPILSPNLSEWFTRQKILGYSVGQLGAISLFDLRYQILHVYLPVPKHLEAPPFNKLLSDPNDVWIKYAPLVEPRLLFVLCDGFQYSPKLQVMHSEIINDELVEAMKDFLDFTISVDKEKKLVQLPQLLDLYALDFDDGQDINSAPFEGLINLISCFVRGTLAESLQSLLSVGSVNEKIDNSIPKQLPFELQFKPLSLKFGITLEYADLKDSFSDPIASVDVSSPMRPQPVVLNYLKEKCWLLADLYHFIANDVHESNGNEKSKLPSKEALPTSEGIHNACPVTQLLLQWQNMIVEVPDTARSKSNWFVSALSPFPCKEFTMDQVTKCFRTKQWQTALQYIDLFIELRDHHDPSFTLLRQTLLQHVASIDPSGESNAPWCWALCIADPICRANCILKNIYRWPDSFAIKSLKCSLSDNVVAEQKNVADSLKAKLKEIEIYQKIFDTSKGSDAADVKDCAYSFDCWQDVAEFSVWDQSVIFNCIKSSGQFQLAVEWAKLHKIDSKHKLVALALQITWYLKQDPPQTTIVYEILEECECSSDCIALVELVLPELSTASSKLCLAQFLVNKGLEFEEHLYYSNMLLGLNMLQTIKSSNKEYYQGLIAHPHLILEQLLMNMEIKEADRALNAALITLQSENFLGVSLSFLSINQLVESYASKALELPTLDDIDSTTSSTTILNTEEIPFTSEQFVMPACVPGKDEWVPDSKVQICQACREEQFNMFSRRHHCRRCGRVVCANCSQKTLIVEGYGNISVRACDDCYNQTVHNTMTGSISPSFYPSSFEKRFRILSSMKASSPRNSPCFLAQDYSDPRRRASTIADTEFFRWVLSPDQELSTSVRNEFSYEPAPSVSLCLSILKLHNNPAQCAMFMLSLCDRLLTKIRPRLSRRPYAEVDYNLVISMIKSLLVNVKIKYHQIHDNEGVAMADVYFQHLDIVKLLVNANCKHLIPKEDLTKSDTVRKLRDRLLEEERMILALEISTKCGLERNGVWSSWGLFCLRAGDWATAREKFQQCLKIPKDRSKHQQESSLLGNIIKNIESCKIPGIGKASAVFRSLSSLDNIQNGLIQAKREAGPFDQRIKEECLYYLSTYGTHFSTVAFYQRHELFSEALSYIIEKKCESDIFVEALFMPTLKCAQLSTLQHLMTSTNPTLSKWWPYLLSTCRCLQRCGYLNVLYQIQLFMEDYIRAAKSSINFYLAPAASYSILYERYHHLHNAKKHYERYLRTSRESSPSKELSLRNKSILTLPLKEVESCMTTVTMQEEVSRFFQSCKPQNFQILLCDADNSDEKRDAEVSNCPHTLFGNRSTKSEVTTMLLVNAIYVDEGFDLAAKIVKEYGLNSTAVLSAAGRQLVLLQWSDQIPHFLNSIKCCFENINIDEIAMECISAVIKQGGDADDLIKSLTSDSSKINAFLMCGKLKNAYLLAIKLQRHLDVHRIMISAEQSGQEAVKRICERWLQSNSQKSKSKTTT